MKDKNLKKCRKTALKNCPGGIKSKLRAELFDTLCTFSGEQPNASYEELVTRFGDPRKYAEEFVAAMDDGEKVKRLRRNTVAKIVVIALLAIMTLLFATGTAAVVYDVFNSETYIIEDTITYEK